MFLQKHLQATTSLSWLALKLFAIKQIPLPELGEKIKEATIKKWHVKIGDTIDEFDGVCDVVTDKLFTTIPASYSGKITKLYHKEEQICQTFAPLYDIDIEGEGQEEKLKEEPKVEAKEEPKVEVKEEQKPEQQTGSGTIIKQIPLPELGEKIKEATIKKWHIKEGDDIEEFDGICDVVTDKLFTTIPASYSGKIKKLYHKEEEICQTFAPLYDIEIQGGEAKEDAKPVEEKKEKEVVAKKEVKAQAVSEKPQTSNNKDIQIAPAVRNLLKQHKIDASQVTGTGKDGRITKDDIMAYLEKGKPTQEVKKVESKKSEGKKDIQLAPAIRNLLKQHKINAEDVIGSGKDGRITKEDVMKYLEKGNAKKEEKQQQTVKQATTPATAKQSGKKQMQAEVITMSDYQKGMQKSMTAAQTIPHMFLMDEIEVTELVNMRNYIKKELKKNVTFMPFFLKAFSLAMVEYPIVNSYYYPEKNPFEYKMCKNHNISIAIDSPSGLVVPSIKNVQNMNIFQIQDELNRIRKSAEEAKVTAQDLFDGTVTFSNIGNITGTYNGPLIVPPQVLIVGMGKMIDVPQFQPLPKGQKPRKIVNVSFAVDHRILDGATVARFIKKWKGYIENPVNFILNMQ